MDVSTKKGANEKRNTTRTGKKKKKDITQGRTWINPRGQSVHEALKWLKTSSEAVFSTWDHLELADSDPSIRMAPWYPDWTEFLFLSKVKGLMLLEQLRFIREEIRDNYPDLTVKFEPHCVLWDKVDAYATKAVLWVRWITDRWHEICCGL